MFKMDIVCVVSRPIINWNREAQGQSTTFFPLHLLPCIGDKISK